MNNKRVALISFILFIAVAAGVINGSTIGFDNSIQSFLKVDNLFLDYFFSFFTHIFDNVGFVLLSLILVGYLYFKESKKSAFFAGIVLFGGAVIGQILKWIFAVQRPEGIVEFLGYSFPSGHAIKVTLFMLLIIVLFKDKINNEIAKKTFIVLGWIVILIVCLSRVYLGAHWPSDVLGGFFFALAWYCLFSKSRAY